MHPVKWKKIFMFRNRFQMQFSTWSSIFKDQFLNKVVYFQVFNGLSAGTYSVLIMLYIQYLDAGLGGDIYIAHFAIYYLVGNLTNAILLYPGGIFADKFGRKPALVVGAWLMAINGFIPPFATVWWELLPASVISAGGSALYTPAQAALVADVSTGYRREKSYSVVYFISTGFTTVGLAIFSIYAAVYQTAVATASFYQLMLLISAFLGLGAVVPIMLLEKPEEKIRKTQVEPARTKKGNEKPEESFEVPAEIKRNSVVIKLLIINLLIGLGAGFIIPLFTYYWEGVFYLSDSAITAITMLGYVGLVFASMFTPWIAKRAKVLGGRIGTIVIFEGTSIICAGYLAIAPFQMSLFPAITAYVARMVLMNAISPLTSALLMDHSPMEKRGLYNALISTAFGVPNSISPIFTYFFYNSAQAPYGFTYPIAILVLLYTISVIIYATIKKADSVMPSRKKA
jgi:MFS family permease